MGRNGIMNGLAFVRTQVVHDDDITRLKFRREHVAGVGEKNLPVHRTVDDERRNDPVMAQTGEEGHRLPVTVRDLRHEPLPARGTAAEPDHFGVRTGFVDEDQTSRIKMRLPDAPEPARHSHVEPILLGGAQGFF